VHIPDRSPCPPAAICGNLIWGTFYVDPGVDDPCVPRPGKPHDKSRPRLSR
jgi:hypothetical protein